MAYNGRRGPNVSEYIANLNAIPTAQDIENSQGDFMDDDLALFTNTDFYDFDLNQSAGLQASNFGVEGQSQATGTDAGKESMDFNLQGTRHCSVLFCYIILAVNVAAVFRGVDAAIWH